MENPVETSQHNKRQIVIVLGLLLLVLAVAAFLRFRGLFWGEYQYLHPDERFLVWVGTDISPVDKLSDYWDTANSSLNPHNRGHGFYVYGTLPMFLARYVVEWVYGHSGFNEMTDVGRVLSALADLLTIFLTFLIGERVYNRRVGLLAAAFGAFAVLQIQHAHFFTMDSFTTCFAMLTIYFAARVAYDSPRQESPKPEAPMEGEIVDLSWSKRILRVVSAVVRNPLFLLSIGFGVALGMAVSSKINAAPLALLLPVAMVIRSTNTKAKDRDSNAWQLFGFLVLAGFISLLVFRICQPYAFSGPGFFGLKPNPAWMANLRELRSQGTGNVDFPPSLQWARRPIWFAWQNMVLWGMGLPLGLLAWFGFLWAGWRILKGEWRQHILLWGWTLLYFSWQSSIFNPSMRYQLLVYPTLVIFPAWAVIRLYDLGKQARNKRSAATNEEPTAQPGPARSGWGWKRIVAVALGGIVLIATAAYAFGFSNIYTTPITRVAASRWIYQNIAGPINLPIQTDSGVHNQIVAFPYGYMLGQERSFFTSITSSVSGQVNEIDFGKIIDPSTNYGQKTIFLNITDFPSQGGLTRNGTFEINLAPGMEGEGYSTFLTQPVEVEQGKKYFVNLQTVPGNGPVKLSGDLYLFIQAGEVSQHIIPLQDVLVDSLVPYALSFESPESGSVVQAILSLDVIPASAGEGTLSVLLSANPDESEVLASGAMTGIFASDTVGGENTLKLDHPVMVEEGTQYYLTMSLDGAPQQVTLRGTALANEGAWDDGLPVRIENYDGYGGIYDPGLNFDMYEDDNPNKRMRFYEILDNAEYLLISSNRQWATLPRLPERFPMTRVYYQHLLGCPPEKDLLWCYEVAKPWMFSGDLGFELVKVFQSDPRIGQVGINDQSAEEAFTVYDHPKVFVFKKTADYDSAQVRDILGSVDLSKVVHITPKQAGSYRGEMLLSQARLAVEQAGGTWSKLFNTQSLLNRWQWLGAIVWYLVVFIVGLAAYPILRFALPGLSDKGYPLARIAGMLLLSYMVWLAGSVGIPFNRITISVAFLIILVIGGLLAWHQRKKLLADLRSEKRYFIMIEALFLAFFLFDLLIRLGNPDLWHPWKGGEKPMDFSYFNAILKSTTFPPYDPWFAQGYLNYYYYGFVLVGVLVKWLGIVPAIAYNLILPTVFGMIAISAFSIGWNVLHAHPSRFSSWRSLFQSSQFVTGISAALGMALFGNLGTLRMIFQGYQRLAAPGGLIEGAGIIARTVWSIKGLLMTVSGAALPYGIADWYWFPSRAIPAPNDVEPITEFPFFTVLYGDPHAHLFALPITLLALSWAVSVVLGRAWHPEQPGQKRSLIQISVSFLIGGLAIAVLLPTNTWDLPLYLALGMAACGYAIWQNYRTDFSLPGFLDGLSSNLKRIFLTLLGPLILAGLTFVLFLPYLHFNVPGYTQFNLWKGSHTPFWSYLTHWGLFLFVIISWMVWETHEWMASTPLRSLRKLSPYRVWLMLGGLLLLACIVALIYFDIWIAWFVLPLVVWAVILFFRPEIPDAKRIILVLIASGLLLTLMVELVVLTGDIGRMNTVFKFYLQVWTLFAISAAAGFGWLLLGLPKWRSSWQIAWEIILLLLVVSAALYPLMGGTAKVKDRIAENAPHTLDGMAFMRYATYDDLGVNMDLSQDYRAIRWLQENVIGSPVIIEGNMVEYHWGDRMTTYTGLPNVLGWNWHQRQQRARAPEYLIPSRIADINDFYLTTDSNRAENILKKYGVKYIILGQLERALYPGPGLAKFDQLNGILWKEVDREDDTVIYEVLN